MKKYIVLLFLGITVSLNAQWIDLDVPYSPQQQSSWCGVAASQSVIGYYKKPYTPQCEIMDYVRRCNLGMYGYTNCCPVNPLYCNNKGLNFFGGHGTGSVGDVLWEFGPVPTSEIPWHLPIQYIIQDLGLKRPIVVQWSDFAGTIGHAVVIHGINGNYIKYVDPWNDSTGGFRSMLYDDFVNDGFVKWTNTLATMGCSGRDYPDHCCNGVQDAHLGETGIDCGGPCEPCNTPPPPPAHCKNGVQDAHLGETGIDCGGPCPPCPPDPCANCKKDPGEVWIDCGGPCGSCEDVLEVRHISNSSQLRPEIMAFKKITAGVTQVWIEKGKNVSFITEEKGTIILHKHFKVEKGAYFRTQRWEDLSGYSRICEHFCPDLAYISFIPAWCNSGIHFYTLYLFSLHNAKKIEYEIFDEQGKFIDSKTLDVTHNGTIDLWHLSNYGIDTLTAGMYTIIYYVHYCTGAIYGYMNTFVVVNFGCGHYRGNSLDEALEETENFDIHPFPSSAPLNISDETSPPTLSVIPNPNTGAFQVETNFSLSEIAHFKIINSLGATVYETQNLFSNTIQLQNSASGLHFVVAMLKDGTMLTQKMVIQR